MSRLLSTSLLTSTVSMFVVSVSSDGNDWGCFVWPGSTSFFSAMSVSCCLIFQSVWDKCFQLGRLFPMNLVILGSDVREACERNSSRSGLSAKELGVPSACADIHQIENADIGLLVRPMNSLRSTSFLFTHVASDESSRFHRFFVSFRSCFSPSFAAPFLIHQFLE